MAVKVAKTTPLIKIIKRKKARTSFSDMKEIRVNATETVNGEKNYKKYKKHPIFFLK